MSIEVGQTIAGRYVLESLLGAGGMGAVYRATQNPLGRTVAIKVIKSGLTDDELAVKRFIAEAKAVAQLSHPHIVTVHDFGAIAGGDPLAAQGGLFIAMEFLDGIDLRDLICARGQLPHRRAAQLGAEIAEALAHAHERGVIHRDLKPDNIMIVPKTGGEQVKVVDFGVAKLRPEPGQSALTQTGMVVGTPGYIAPEFVNGIGDDPRSDLYALGVILYEAVSGRSPFDAETPVKLVLRHVTEIPLRPSDIRPELRLPPAFDALIMSLLQKDPNQRPPNALAVAQALRGFANDATAVLPSLVDDNARAVHAKADRKAPQGTVSSFIAPAAPAAPVNTPLPTATPNAVVPVPVTPPTPAHVHAVPAPATRKSGSMFKSCLIICVVMLGLVAGLIVIPAIIGGVSIAEDVLEATEALNDINVRITPDSVEIDGREDPDELDRMAEASADIAAARASTTKKAKRAGKASRKRKGRDISTRDLEDMSLGELAKQSRSKLMRALKKEVRGLDSVERYEIKRELAAEIGDGVARGELSEAEANRLMSILDDVIDPRR